MKPLKVNCRCLFISTKNISTFSDPRLKFPKTISSGGKEASEFVNEDLNGFESGDMMQEGWKECHASNSEAIIKAERHVDRNPEELQQDSVKFFKKHNKEKR